MSKQNDQEPIVRAAKLLKRHLSNYDWVELVGLGVGKLFVYTSRPIQGVEQPITQVGDYSVEYLHVGEIAPA